MLEPQSEYGGQDPVKVRHDPYPIKCLISPPPTGPNKHFAHAPRNNRREPLQLSPKVSLISAAAFRAVVHEGARDATVPVAKFTDDPLFQSVAALYLPTHSGEKVSNTWPLCTSAAAPGPIFTASYI